MKCIAAMSLNRVIGKENQIPWHYTEDFRFFREKTKNQTIVVGTNTFISMGALPNREILVLTHSILEQEALDALAETKKNCSIRTINSITQIPNDAWICGGSSIYEQTMDLCTELYLTIIHKEVDGDAFLPWFEGDFNLLSSEEVVAEDGITLEFRHYINNLVNSFNPLNHEQVR